LITHHRIGHETFFCQKNVFNIYTIAIDPQEVPDIFEGEGLEELQPYQCFACFG